MNSSRYTVYVDVSAKIEDWKHDSVIAAANGHTMTLLIKAETKRTVAALLTDDAPIQFTLLALFTYFVVRHHLQHIGRIVIDLDYSGKFAERTIQKKLLAWIRKDAPDFKGQNISMKNVKDSRADHLARNTYRGHQQPNGEITVSEIKTLLQNKK